VDLSQTASAAAAAASVTACAAYMQVLTCDWSMQPPRAVGVDAAVAGSAVSVVCDSWSGAYRLIGTADGQVRTEELGQVPR
jgi:hypothetical protein